jgi:hypothetical protein
MAMEGGPDGLAVPQCGYMEEEPLWRLWWRRSHECATEEASLGWAARHVKERPWWQQR